MRLLNTIFLGSAPGGTAELEPLHRFVKGKKARNILVRTSVTVQNSTGSAATVKAADAEDFLAFLFSSVRTMFGVEAGAQDVVDDSVPYETMSLFNSIVTGNGFYVRNSVTGEWSDVSQMSGSTAISASVAAGSSTVVQVQFCRPFSYAGALDHEHDWCPGETQMGQLSFQVTAGSVFNPTNSVWVQQGLAQMRIYSETVDDDSNPWSKVIRTFRNTTPGNSQNGPAGALIACLDTSYTGYASPLGIYSISRKGDSDLMDPLELQDYLAAVGGDDILGGTGGQLNLTATVLYLAYSPAALKDFATSSQFVFNQPGGELATPATTWVFIPHVTSGDLDKIGANATSAAGGTGSTSVKMISKASDDPTTPANVVAVSAVSLAKPGSTDYTAAPGRIADRGVPTSRPSIPATISSAAKQTSGKHGQTVANSLARAIPGESSPSRAQKHQGAAKLSASVGIKP